MSRRVSFAGVDTLDDAKEIATIERNRAARAEVDARFTAREAAKAEMAAAAARAVAPPVTGIIRPIPRRAGAAVASAAKRYAEHDATTALAGLHSESPSPPPPPTTPRSPSPPPPPPSLGGSGIAR